jgi:hypothetical protein
MRQGNQRVHNRFKLPFLLVCLATGTGMAIGGAMTGLVGLVAPGAIAAVASVAPLWVISTGRGNPWWMRSPLDPSADDDAGDGPRLAGRKPVGASTAESEHRAKYGFLSVIAVGFVVAGVALIVIGATTSRWDKVFVGALCCLFFGACAWIGLALLRRSV